MRLTKRAVESVSPPAVGQLFVRDDKLAGFALRVTAGGSRSFVWEGRVNGRVRRFTLGSYPAMSVERARKRALKAKSNAADGIDPVKAKQARLKAATFAKLRKDYLEKHGRPHRRTFESDETRLDNHVPEEWNGRKLSDISADDVIRLHQRIGRDHGRILANRIVALLRTMWNLARDWNLTDGLHNPASRVKFFDESERDRFLSPEELRRVNRALADENSPYWRAYFPLCLILGTRRNELLAARWADIDLAQETWRLPTTKTGRSHLLPLPTVAVEIIRSLPSFGVSEWVFPGKGKTGHLAQPTGAWKRIRERAGVPDVRIHDLRRTLGSWLAGAGYSLPLIGRALNHRRPATTSIYARLDLEPLRKALESNATAMLGNRPTLQ